MMKNPIYAIFFLKAGVAYIGLYSGSVMNRVQRARVILGQEDPMERKCLPHLVFLSEIRMDERLVDCSHGV